MLRSLWPVFSVSLVAACTGGPPGGDLNFDRQVDQESEDDQVDSTDVQFCAANDGHLYVVWIDDRQNFKDVWFSSSVDGGTDWSEPVRVKKGDGDASGVSLACAGERVYVAWEDTRDSATRYQNIYVNFSADGGRKWRQEDIRIDDDPEGRYISLSPQIVIFNGGVHVVWFDQIDGAPSVYMASSENGGRDWAAPLRVSGDPENPGEYWSGNPRAAVDADGRVHIVWEDTRAGAQDIWYARSNAAHDGFTDQIRLSKGSPPGKEYSFAPSLGLDGDNVYVAWHDTRGGESLDVYLNYSNNGGGQWLDEAVRVESDQPGSAESRDVDLVVVGDVAHIVWEDNRTGGYDIYYRAATAGAVEGADEEERLDVGDQAGTGNSVRPQIALGGDTLVVAWEDLRNGGESGLNDLYYNFKSGSDSWKGDDFRLNSVKDGTSFTEDLHIAVLGDAVYAAWLDFRQGKDDGDVYFSTTKLGEGVNTAADLPKSAQ